MPDSSSKPIKTALHGQIDYGFTAVNLFGPTLFGLTGAAAAIPRVLAFAQGGLNALTRQPLAIKPLIPMRVHGNVEAATIPMLGLIAAKTGALETTRGKLFFGLTGAALATVYSLTDWDDPAGNDDTFVESGASRHSVTIAGEPEEVEVFLKDPDAIGQFARADGWDGGFELRPAPGGRGTEVYADADRNDLRRAKQLYESGEIVTAETGVHGRRGPLSSKLPNLDTGS